MVKMQKLPRLTFTITPNANGYVVGCMEIPYLFTDVPSVENIDQTIRTLILDYVDSFPDDAQKRGVDKEISTQTVWKGSPNSVALE
ncbi:MAG TPA: hypothetical protein VJ792_00065 [Candidatus Nitrosotalea sp.]|nr:hypothetical protein [Candidatus Nitrosotalea sp.]